MPNTFVVMFAKYEILYQVYTNTNVLHILIYEDSI